MKLLSSKYTIFIAILLGIISGFSGIPFIHKTAEIISEIFMNLLKMVSLPIIFLSIASTIGKMSSFSEVKYLGRRVIQYTLMTTFIAASLACALFILINPTQLNLVAVKREMIDSSQLSTQGITHYLLKTIPDSVVSPFVEGNVLAVLLLALIAGFGILSLPSHQKETLQNLLSTLYALVMKVTQGIVFLIPLAMWTFITLLIQDIDTLPIGSVLLYLICVLGANAIQATVVLPLLLKIKNISIGKLFSAVMPALSMAFLTKSSSATLPMTIECIQKRAQISQEVSSFSIPLCTTMNMNGCAAFILTTVLFVGTENGIAFNGADYIIWILVATLAAIGNASVPMGCFFLSGALLASMNVPLDLMWIILPFYTIIDMFETAINVWSDCCITAIVDREYSA